MKKPRGSWLCRMAIAALTLPLFQTSCIEVAQRSLINGIFHATTPLLDAQLAVYLAGKTEAPAEP